MNKVECPPCGVHNLMANASAIKNVTVPLEMLGGGGGNTIGMKPSPSPRLLEGELAL